MSFEKYLGLVADRLHVPPKPKPEKILSVVVGEADEGEELNHKVFGQEERDPFDFTVGHDPATIDESESPEQMKRACRSSMVRSGWTYDLGWPAVAAFDSCLYTLTRGLADGVPYSCGSVGDSGIIEAIEVDIEIGRSASMVMDAVRSEDVDAGAIAVCRWAYYKSRAHMLGSSTVKVNKT